MEEREKKMYDFFISHASIDKESIVENLVHALKHKGCTVWYDKTEIPEGKIINESIEDGLKESYSLILIVTEKFVESKWCHIEIGKFPTSKKRRVIPIVFNISESSYTHLLQVIGNSKYINAKGKTIDEIASILAKIVSDIKDENQDLIAIEQLQIVHKKINSYESMSSSIISIRISEYFKMLESHEDYIVLSSKNIVESSIHELLKFMGTSIENPNLNYPELVNLVTKLNITSYDMDEYIKFILFLDLKTPGATEKLLINQALHNFLNWYISLRYPININTPRIEVIHPEELTYEDFISMYELDKIVMREDLIASVETSYGWYKYNNYTHIAIKDTQSKKVVGYFAMLPITQETYNHIMSGDFKDNEFTDDAILQFSFPGFYCLYVAGVAIHPEYQNTHAFAMLYYAIVDLLLILARDRQIYITEVIAEASTKQGEKLCKMIGMKKKTVTTSGTDVYALILIPPEFRLHNNRGKALFEICQQKYEEYRDYFDLKTNS